MKERSQQNLLVQRKVFEHLHCSICAKTKTASIAATGHQHTEIRKKKDATCGEDGYTGNTYCTDCKKTISYGQTIKKTGNHTWDDGKSHKRAYLYSKRRNNFYLHCM